MNKRKIEQLASKQHIKTITVDVFDTILLRKVWPEDLQFLTHAGAVLPLLRKHISGSITAYEFYSFRQYARRVWYAGETVAMQDAREKTKAESKHDAFTQSLLDSDPEISIEVWFELTLTMLAEKYGVILGSAKTQDLAQKMIGLEIAVERQYLRPNKPLIRWLRKLKTKYNVRVYYLSDMYLGVRQLELLLNHFNLQDLFAGGSSSADLGAGKWNGKAFAHISIKQIFGEFELASNVHIGDNRISDHAMPLQAGSNALWYRSHHTDVRRPFFDWLGHKRLAQVQKAARRSAKKQYFEAARNSKTVREDLAAIGRTFALPTVYYLDYMINRAKVSGERLLMVSSEAHAFDGYAQSMYSRQFLRGAYNTADKINRKRVLSALLYVLAKDGPHSQLDRALEDILQYGERLQSRQAMMSFITGQTDPAQSLLALEHVSGERFSAYALAELRRQVKLPDSRLSALTLIVERQLAPVRNAKSVTLIDVGWGGSVQMFLQNYFQHSERADVQLRGGYVGAFRRSRFRAPFLHQPEGIVLKDVESPEDQPLFVPWLWEYIFTNKHKNDGKLPYIQQGIHSGIAHYRQNVHLSPLEAWAVGRSELERLFRSPTRREVGLLGSVTIDAGFNKSEMIPMVSMKSSVKRQYFNLFTRPKHFYRTITAEYCWTIGYLTWYRMRWLGYLLPLARRMR